MNKKIIFLFVFLVLFSVNALGVPPQTNDNGLLLSFPDFETGKVSTAWEIPVHVYRASDGVVQFTNVNCSFHVYNSTGNHIIESYDDTPSHTYDYELAVSNSDITETGLYAFQVYCVCEQCSLTNTDLGGYVRHTFEVTSDGYAKNHEGTGVLIALFLIPIILIVIFLVGGMSLGEDHSVLKIFLYLLTIPFIWILNHWGTIALIKFYGLTDLQNSISDFTLWTSITFSVIVTYFIIYAIWKMFNNMNKRKEDRLNY